MEKEDSIIFGLTNSQKIDKKISKITKVKNGKYYCEKFPDGELHIRLGNDITGKKTFLVQSMNPEPNNSLIELIYTAKTAKEIGAKKVYAIVPYLGYMRQDRRFKEGECISAKIMANLLNDCLDGIATIDPHLHRIKSLSEIFNIKTLKLSADKTIAEYIKRNYKKENTLIVGPDIESSQWAKKIAEYIGFESTIFLKNRLSSRRVRINVTKELDWEGKDVIIIDDIISTGHTMVEAIKEIRKRGVNKVDVICVHAIMAEKAYEKIKKAGATKIVSCNTVKHESNRIDISKICCEAYSYFNEDKL